MPVTPGGGRPLIMGVTPQGVMCPIRLNDDGVLLVSGAGIPTTTTFVAIADSVDSAIRMKVNADGSINTSASVVGVVALDTATLSALESISARQEGPWSVSVDNFPTAAEDLGARETTLAAFRGDFQSTMYRLLNQMIPDGYYMRTALNQAPDTTGKIFGMAPDGALESDPVWDCLRIGDRTDGTPGIWSTRRQITWTVATSGTGWPT